MGECNTSTAAEMVKHQIGLVVVLLDSKLYPVLNNETTRGVDFWKSTWKIIAVARSTYESFVDVRPGEELSQLMAIDDALGEPEGQTKL